MQSCLPSRQITLWSSRCTRVDYRYSSTQPETAKLLLHRLPKQVSITLASGLCSQDLNGPASKDMGVQKPYIVLQDARADRYGSQMPPYLLIIAASSIILQYL